MRKDFPEGGGWTTRPAKRSEETKQFSGGVGGRENLWGNPSGDAIIIGHGGSGRKAHPRDHERGESQCAFGIQKKRCLLIREEKKG